MKTKNILIIFSLAVAIFAVALWIKSQPASVRPSLDKGTSSASVASNSNASLTTSPLLPTAVVAQPVSVTNLMKQLAGLKTKPSSALVTNFTLLDEAPLLNAYQTTPLSNRTALVWALAQIGGDATAQAFIHTLRDEFASKKLVADEGGSVGSEEAVMETIVNALGFVASRSDIAYEFLRQATEPDFWQNTVTWQSSTGKEINGLLTSSAIQGLGLATREDVPQLLQQLKNNLPVDTTVPPQLRRSFAGDVVQAAYYQDMRTQMGNTAFCAWFLDQERDVFDSDGSYRKWTAVGNGAEWKQWYLAQIK